MSMERPNSMKQALNSHAQPVVRLPVSRLGNFKPFRLIRTVCSALSVILSMFLLKLFPILAFLLRTYTSAC